MDIGDFDRLVVLRKPGVETNDWAEVDGAPEIVGRAWANIRHQTGAEAIRADGVVSTVRASVRIWGYRTDLTNAMEVVDGTDVYRVRAVMPDKIGREWVDLVCELVV